VFHSALKQFQTCFAQPLKTLRVAKPLGDARFPHSLKHPNGGKKIAKDELLKQRKFVHGLGEHEIT
jgi:hypothetical protein